MQTRVIKAVVVPFIIVLIFSCVGKKEPTDAKRRLTEYISKSFSIKSVAERKELEAFLTGDAKTRLAAWSDEQFLEAFVNGKRGFVKLTFREVKSVNDKQTNVTYELIYTDTNRGKNARITNRKLATLVLQGDLWKIQEVKNIRELVEFNQEMSLP